MAKLMLDDLLLRVTNIASKVVHLRTDMDNTSTKMSKTDEQVAELGTALNLVDRDLQKIQTDMLAYHRTQTWCNAEIKTQEEWLKEHEVRHKEHLERAMRFEDQLRDQTLELERKIMKMEGQMNVCHAEIAHAVQIKTLMESKVAQDPLTASLLMRVENTEKAHQQIQTSTATVVAGLSRKLLDRLEVETRNIQDLKKIDENISSQMKDLRLEINQLSAENNHLHAENTHLNGKVKSLENQQKGFEKMLVNLESRFQNMTVTRPPAENERTKVPAMTQVIPPGPRAPEPGKAPEPVPEPSQVPVPPPMAPQDIANIVRSELNRALQPQQSSTSSTTRNATRLGGIVTYGATPVSVNPELGVTQLPLYTERAPSSWPMPTQIQNFTSPEITAQNLTPSAPYMGPVTVLNMVSAQPELPEHQIRAIGQAGGSAQAPSGATQTAPQVPQLTLAHPLLWNVPVDKPVPFNGTRRDWWRFSREFDKYDRDILSMGAATDAARIRVLAALLDTAGKLKVERLQQEAAARGQNLTLPEAKAHLAKEFETGAQDARAELKALVPTWPGGRPNGPAWRNFAEQFRQIAKIASEVSEDEKREHLLTCCLTQQLHYAVLGEDRKRGNRPRALIAAFRGVPTTEVEAWLRHNNVAFHKLESAQDGHKVQCASQEDLQRLSVFHKTQVLNGGTPELVNIFRIDMKMSSAEILNFVGLRLADEEICSDGRRLAQQLYGQAPRQAVHFENTKGGVRRRSVNSLVSEEGEFDTDHRVAAVESKK